MNVQVSASKTTRTTALAALAAIVLLAPLPAAAAKGGKPGGGGGGPGGGDPPANPEIAFFDPGGSAGDLMVMNADGSNAVVVVADVAGASLGDVSWSPDGGRLVFSSRLDGRGLWVVGVDGTGLAKITDTTPEINEPSWSPVGSDGSEWIAFNDSPAENERNVYLVRADGTGRYDLSVTSPVFVPGYNQGHPTWSPDGMQMAVVRTGQGQGGRVRVFDIDWSGVHPVIVSEYDATAGTDLDGMGMTDVNWAKAGATLVVSARDKSIAGSLKDLWTLDLIAVEASQVTDTSDVDERGGSWSPGDSEIGFQNAAESRKSQGTRAVAPDGTGGRLIRKGDSRAPDWRRAPPVSP